MKVNADRRTHRVIKTLAPTDRGAIELAAQYGRALVCVRHRTDAKGKVRHTTVELLIQSKPIRPRVLRFVHIQLERHEHALANVIESAGGRWDPKHRLWQIPSRVATILNLRNRIVEK